MPAPPENTMPDEGNDNPTPTPRKAITPSSETKPAAKKGKKDKPEPTTLGGKLWHNWVKPIGTVIVIVVVLRSMLLDWNDVPTGSMEPEIQVGDRIAVNRLAYALQAPLSGPKLSIPFTGLSWDNPLDGIPQLQWGKPQRGDIVTFWNPVTGVRMVKRIVAEPGDTISMSGGVMTINGTTATYQDITPSPQRQTKYFKPGPLGKPDPVFEDLEDHEETLLGETRTVQYIKERWMTDTQIIELQSGDRALVNDGTITRIDPATRRPIDIAFSDFLQRSPQDYRVFAEVVDGVILIDGKQATYNDLADKMLEAYRDGPVANALAKATLSIDGHRLMRNGEEVSLDLFENAAKNFAGYDEQDAAQIAGLLQSLRILGQTTMTNFGPVTLGEDEYFMVGDNRNNSHDSRRFGPIDRGEITGEAFAVAFSFKDNKILTLPPKPAWSRWFKDLD